MNIIKSDKDNASCHYNNKKFFDDFYYLHYRNKTKYEPEFNKGLVQDPVVTRHPNPPISISRRTFKGNASN